MRALKWIAGSLFALVVLAVVLVAAIWWWAGTEGSARFALEQVAKRQPITAEGVTGSLRHGLRIERLAWSQDGLQAEAKNVELAWQPLALLQRLLKLDRLTASEVSVRDQRPPTGGKPQPPRALGLPLRVAVDDFEVGRFTWAGGSPVELRDLAASYGYDGSSHRLDLRNLRAWDGTYRGEVRLGAAEPFTLNASLQGRVAAPVPGAGSPLPLVFDARADGPLAGFDLRGSVQPEGTQAGPGAQARVTARVTPWAAMPLERAQADFEGFDPAALWGQAPHLVLSGAVRTAPAGTSTWTLSGDLRNAEPGPWDKHRVPASRVKLEGEWRAPHFVLLRELDADAGGGRVRAQGVWEGEDAWKVEAALAGVNPAAVHTAMAPLPLSGRATVRAQGAAWSFDTELAASGARARQAPASNEIAATVGALELRSLRARGRWAEGQLALPLLQVATSDAKLDAAVDVQPSARSGRGRAQLEAPGLLLRGVGSVGPRTGGGTVKLNADDLAAAQRWLQKIPGVPEALRSPQVMGRGELQLAWQGGWDDPTVQGTLSLPLLQAVAPPGQPALWAVRDATAKLDGRLADARVDLRAQAQAGTRALTLEAAGRGGRRANGAWQGQLASLVASLRDSAIGPGPWRVTLRRPMDFSWQAGRFEAGASEAVLAAPVTNGAPSQAEVSWDPVRWSGGQLRTAGRITGLPMTWIELVGGPQFAGSAFSGDMVFDAQWDALLGDTMRVRASLARRSGDVAVMAETAEGASARVQAGVREARVTVEGEGESITAALRWDSERAGTAQARLTTRLARAGGGWSWPEDAPLSGQVRAQLPRLGVWSLVAPPGWRLRGSLNADVNVAGTRAEPSLTGTLAADDLALRSVVDGIALHDGRMRARLEGRRLVVSEFTLRGSGAQGGTVTGSGEGGWMRDGLQVRLDARLDRLRASIRTDRELTVSGTVQASMDSSSAAVRGQLRVDRARIVLPDETAPALGSDVVVRNLPPGVSLGRNVPREPEKQQPRSSGRPLVLAVALDLGDDFRVQGRGIGTRLAGTLNVGGETITAPRLTGVINTVGGEYQAYGQRLDIERGVLRFTGPVDNPALDILAIRPRMAQRVGVQVTGTAQSPFVRLYAEPDLPEAEKLSWLVLGRASASGGAETALLQSAALALLESRSGRSGGKGPAALLGLDELGFRRDSAEGPAVTLGKRLGQNLYASYERSLSGALGTLYVFYDLSQRVTVRAQAGERAAVDLIFTFAYD
ncbi:translocation/assembly module TamB domain-containing protein [Ramlibacter humi]|uniref:DUF490 domain-containing protein n=1 Tax=Ramlibacter humi TaxID=2530451 RepID=A0A4Z0BPP6_9BURK|nr:translocation/assembly module TamB domain-containing protein [Ramlibacter humi]TFZ00218.1 DUF490 domain-containing protein [Ramlibacter humi]